MQTARRQHRASPQSRKATFDRGITQALSALYSSEQLTPERAAAMRHALALVPYSKRQGELALPMGDSE